MDMKTALSTVVAQQDLTEEQMAAVMETKPTRCSGCFAGMAP